VAVVLWNPEDETLDEAAADHGLGLRQWIELVGAQEFHALDDFGEVELIAEVDDAE